MNLQEVVLGGQKQMYTAVGDRLRYARWYHLRQGGGSTPAGIFLISTETATCGGSAIAVGPITGVTEDDFGLPGAILRLNSMALLTFPATGTWLRLSQSWLGLWVALAIHDTLVGGRAPARYGFVALGLGTTVTWHAHNGSFLCRWTLPPSKSASLFPRTPTYKFLQPSAKNVRSLHCS